MRQARQASARYYYTERPSHWLSGPIKRLALSNNLWCGVCQRLGVSIHLNALGEEQWQTR